MASNLGKVTSEITEDKAARIGKTACKREACAIQACLQGVKIHKLTLYAEQNRAIYSK